jgi:FtsH-binding integral membrane protein
MSGLVAWQVSQNPDMAMSIVQNRPVFWTLFILQLGSVMFLTAAINRISSTVAGLVYFAYAALTGLTLSIIFLMYTSASIFSMFLLTGFAFSGLSAVGYLTKKDLGPVGSFCTMGLFGMLGVALVSMFFPSIMEGSGSVIFGAVGVLVFAGLTAYDTQKIKGYHQLGTEGTEANKKSAIVGALMLYLDFINLFLSLLRIFGRRR